MMTNIVQDLARKIALGGEDASCNKIALDSREPDFDLIEPGGISWGVVDGEVGIGLKERGDAFGFMRRKIVGDNVDFLARRLRGDEFSEKGDELCAGMAFCGLADNLTALGVQGRVKRERSMSEVFESVAFGPSRRKRQHRIKSVQRLNSRFLVDTEDHCIDRRFQIQADNLGGFGLKIRVVTGHVAAKPMRLKSSFRPHSNHTRLAGLELSSQGSTAPLRHTARSFAMQRPVNYPRLNLLTSGVRLPTTVATIQPRKPFGYKTITPENDCIHAAVFGTADLPKRTPTGQCQNDPRSFAVFTARLAAAGQFIELLSLWWAYHKRCGHVQNYDTSVSEVKDSLH